MHVFPQKVTPALERLIRLHDPAYSHHITANKLHPVPTPPTSTLPYPNTISCALHHPQLVGVICALFSAFWTFSDTERTSAKMVGGSVSEVWAVGEVSVFSTGCNDGHPVAATPKTTDAASSTHTALVVHEL